MYWNQWQDFVPIMASGWFCSDVLVLHPDLSKNKKLEKGTCYSPLFTQPPIPTKHQVMDGLHSKIKQNHKLTTPPKTLNILSPQKTSKPTKQKTKQKTSPTLTQQMQFTEQRNKIKGRSLQFHQPTG